MEQKRKLRSLALTYPAGCHAKPSGPCTVLPKMQGRWGAAPQRLGWGWWIQKKTTSPEIMCDSGGGVGEDGR